jgi:hypothetical protein
MNSYLLIIFFCRYPTQIYCITGDVNSYVVEAYEQQRYYRWYVVNSGFNYYTRQNDIGLIRMLVPFDVISSPYTKYIATWGSTNAGDVATIVGWGSTTGLDGKKLRTN